MNQAVDLICNRFGLSYVGLFLVEEQDESSGVQAVLRANAGPAEQPLPEPGIRLPIDETSMIGWSIAYGQARVATEAQADAVSLAQAEPAETRSEATLPLRSRGQVIGALSVQHTQPGAFDPATVVILQTMVDQVAIALDNARLFAERQVALESAQRAYGELSREAWQEILSARRDLGFRSGEQGMDRADDVWRPEMDRALRTGQIVRGDGRGSDGGSSLAVPIKVRGEIVGVLDTYKPPGAGDWTREEIALLEAIATQLDSALESARLYQDTQRRAAREQAIRQVTEEMRRAVDVEAILQNTVSQLTRALGVPRAYVRLGTEGEMLLVQRPSRSEDG
jgi:GAF domain-containing protein